MLHTKEFFKTKMLVVVIAESIPKKVDRKSSRLSDQHQKRNYHGKLGCLIWQLCMGKKNLVKWRSGLTRISLIQMSICGPAKSDTVLLKAERLQGQNLEIALILMSSVFEQNF